jgi:hypothetical protein
MSEEELEQLIESVYSDLLGVGYARTNQSI